MLNVIFPFDQLMMDEFSLGLVYGITVAASLLVMGQRQWRTLVGVWVVIAAGCWGIYRLNPINSESRMFFLALLVGVCRLGKVIHERLQIGSHRARQFRIGELMFLTMVVAVAMFAVKRTDLIERDRVFWMGTILFVVGSSISFATTSWGIRHRAIGLVSMGVLATFGFAMADSSWVQPDRLSFQEALGRYGSIMLGMIVPQLLVLTLFRKLHDFARFATRPSVPRSVAEDESERNRDAAVEQAQSSLRIFS